MDFTAPGKIKNRIFEEFPALRHKNYRLYFTGQLISLTGSWLQGVALGWLIYTITHSAFWLGAVSAASALPVLLLSLFGGYLVDRFNRKKLLFFTQGCLLLLAFILGILTLNNAINLPVLLIITVLSGTVSALDNPISQAFVVDIVDKEDLPSAIGLNSTIFNLGRVLGPAVAGFLIALVGIGNIFLINAFSFVAILISLYFIRINIELSKKKDNPVSAIKEGVEYSLNHPVLSLLLLTAGIGAVFCFSQATIMPVIAEKVFSKGSVGLGYLLSATGLGALLGSLIISSRSKQIKPACFIIGGNILFLVSTFIFSFITNIYWAAFFLFFSGLGLTMQFSTIYTLLQKMVKEEFRGRISSIYILMFVGLSPVGNILLGSAASVFGPQFAIRFATAAVFFYGIFIYLNLHKVKKSYQEYQG